MAVSANKINGVRAALVHNELTAEKSREHNDANIIALGAWITDDNNNISFVNKWLGTDYGEYRHVKRVEKIDPQKDNLVLTNGCFDIIHTGHIKLLEWSKSLGNKLIVALNSDKSIRSIKGESRPINSENDRRAILMSMSFVDDCIIFDDTSPTRIIETINPEIVVKGGEWTADEVRSRDKIADHIEIKIFPFYKNYSTIILLKKYILMNQNKIREALLSAHLQLVNNELVKGTSGNISLRIGKNIIIKPSGVSYNLLKRSDFVVVSIENNRVIKGTLKPSTDTQSHIEIYKNLPDVNSVIHTHSPYATAFAVAGKPIPCYMTSIADEFGGDIPIGKMVDIGDDKIGHEFARVYKKFRSDVVLMKGHGVFVLVIH